jgi:dihydroorotate dehydrogenase
MVSININDLAMSNLYKQLLRPLLFRMPPETAHELGIEALRLGLSSKAAQNLAAKRFDTDVFGEIERFGMKFGNPLGVAAGFDKNGKVVNQLAALGFGFVEVGTITYEPQPGNEKPRLFRLPDDQALINRLGFNNDGAVKVIERLKKIDPRCVLGVNIGKNKNVPIENATENYLKSFELAHEVADYIAVNISSPNTPNLRELQSSENLEELLGALQERNRDLSRQTNTTTPAEAATPPLKGGELSEPPEGGTPNLKPLLVKIAPDLSESEIETIVDIAMRFDVAGIIATNTTVSRDGLKTSNVDRFGSGGLSGKPLAAKANAVISSIYNFSKGRLPIIGVGGIFTAEDAFEKIAAGACLLQAYTGFVYHGMSFARDINVGLADILKKQGIKSIDDATGIHVSK